jgi:hypothetical protein
MQQALYQEQDSPMMAWSKKILAAGLAGILNWVPTYPLDVIKSII